MNKLMNQPTELLQLLDTKTSKFQLETANLYFYVQALVAL